MTLAAPQRYADRAGFVVRVLAVGTHLPVGTGFLVDESHLVTCAHVINAALRRDEREQSDPGMDVRIPVDFPILGDTDDSPVRFCRVVRWLPPPLSGTSGEDIAGLVLVGERPPLDAGPARLLEDPRLSLGSEVHVFGHPATPPRQTGSWASARMLGRVGGGMVQVESTSAVRLQPGYSGSPLVTDDSHGDSVVGMLSVASTRDEFRDAYGVPVDRLVRAWPEVLAGIPPSPYPGLRPFTAADEAVFFGREEDTGHLLELIGEDSLAVVIGPSGIGKSSLVNAGLIPRWRAEGGLGVAIRPGPGTTGVLDRVLSDVEVALRSATGIDAWQLDEDARVTGLAAAVSRRAEAMGTRVLLHLDQFEELLGGIAAAERREVVDTLLPGPHDSALACRIVATVRADFLPMLLELPGQGARLRHRILALSPMSAAALERAVIEPARSRGVEYEAGLAGQIAADASGGPGSLPLMEFTLAQLWRTQRKRRLAFADYRGFGGVTGAINRHAERCYERFQAQGRAAEVKAVMLALVRTRGGAAEANSRAVPRSRFDATGLLVEELCQYRLLVVEPGAGDEGGPLVRLAHESLIRAWSRFAHWVDDDAEFQRWLAAMEERSADDELLSESRLGPAERWLAERRSDIPDDVVHLVERSRSAWRRRVAELEAARARAEEAASRAQRAAADAEARRLAAASELETATGLPGSPLPLVLATASIRTAWTREGDTALRHALRRAPRLIAQLPEDQHGGARNVFGAAGDHLIRTVFIPGAHTDTVRRRTRLFELDFAQPGTKEVHHEEGDLQFTPDTRALLRTDGRRVVLIDRHTGAVLAEDLDDRPVVSSLLNTAGTRMVVIRGASTTEGRDDAVHDATIQCTDTTTGAGCHVFSVKNLRGKLSFSPDCTMLAATAQWYDSDRRHRWLTRTVIVDLTGARTDPIVIEHDGAVSGAIAFSPDNRLLVAGVNNVDSCGDAHDGAVQAFDLAQDGARLYRLPHYLPVKAVAFDQSGQLLAIALGDTRRQRPGAGQVLEAHEGRELHRLHHDYPVVATAFNADGSRVMFAGTRSARVFDTRRGTEFFQVDHEEELVSVLFHPDGRRLRSLAEGPDGAVAVFESRGSEISRIDYDSLPASAFVVADGTTAFITDEVGRYSSFAEERTHTITAVDTMSAVHTPVTTQPGNTRIVAATADGSHLVLAQGAQAQVHDVRGKTTPLVIDHPDCGEVLHASVTDDGRQLITIAGQHNVFRSSDQFAGETVVITGEGTRIATPAGREARLSPYAPRAKTLRITDLRHGGVVCTTDIGGTVMAVSRDGTLVATFIDDEDALLSLHDAARTEHGLISVMETHGGAVRGYLRTLAGPTAVEFGPEGDWIAILRDRSLRLHPTSEVSTSQPLWTAEFDFFPQDISVGSGGSRIAVHGVSTSAGDVLAVLSASDGAHLGTFQTSRWNTSTAFSSDDRRIAVLRDKAACVIDLDSGVELCVVEHEQDPIFGVSFVGKEGRNILTSDRSSLRVSPVDSGDLLREAETRLTRELTDSERRRYRLTDRNRD